MILEGFEIENLVVHKKVSWPACRRRVIYFTAKPKGKSSIVQALRYCLMDYASTSTSKAVTSCYPEEQARNLSSP